MIPSDLVARLRLMTETTVRALAPVHEIPADLPEFSAGQRFSARIEAALPDGTFRALVAGRSLTLALPQPARPGESLDLVVTERRPQLIVARHAADALPRPDPGMAAAAPPATLSRAGQIIGSLLAGQSAGTAAGTPDALPTRIAPLLPFAPVPAAAAAALAPALQQAIGESGLFYEAHQAQWIAGRHPLEALLREPQARLAHAAPPGTAAAAAPDAPAPAEGTAPPAAATPGGSAAESAARLAPELQAVVQQQLDTAATQQVVWRGELWPGQTLHWEIAGDTPRGAAGEDDAAAPWTSRLRLVLPQLGEVTAELRLTPPGVGIALTAEPAQADLLRAAQDQLAGALDAAGVPLLALAVAGGRMVQ